MKPYSPSRGPWQPPSLEEMQTLLPQFQFLALIGRGGMGAVYQARQLSLNRTVAIKVLPAVLVSEAESDFAERFRLEAKTMAKLTHPGIVSVFDSGEAGGFLYIVMEYVDGTDVARMIQSEGKLPPERAIALLAEVCDALHYAHQNGVIHRDLKPANLLVTREGRVKIADFGLAKHNDEALLGLTKTNVAIGTPDFLAPEAWTPGTPLDARADLYALGVTLYQMLTGEVPRGLWKMPSVKVGTDPRFDAIVDRAMQPEREARYQSSVELRRDLERIRSEPPNTEYGSALDGPPSSEPNKALSSGASAAHRHPASSLRRVVRTGVFFTLVTLVGLIWWHVRNPDSGIKLRSATYAVVTSAADSGAGSLRETIIAATNSSTISFAPALSGGIIALTSGELVLEKDLTIDASSLPSGIQISGSKRSRIFQVTSNVAVVLDSLTIMDGGSNRGDGGGILAFGNLTLRNCSLTGNQGPRAGGAVWQAAGILRAINSTFAGNYARSSGGAIGCSGMGVRIELIHCTISDNHSTAVGRAWGGGGLYVWSSPLIISNCVIAGNTSASGQGPDLWQTLEPSRVAVGCLIGKSDGSGVAGGTNGCIVELDPLLAPFGRHGGPTPTMPPLPGSPLLDSAVGVALSVDQRGVKRPVGQAADIGAVEGLSPFSAR